MQKIHLDPRTKLLLQLFIVLFTILSPSLWEEIMMMTLITILSLLHREYKRSMSFLAAYVVVRALLYFCIYIPNALGGIIMIICGMACKMLPTAMFAFCILLNTKISSLITGMQRMGISQKITITLAAALRFIPTAIEDMKGIKHAMKLRGIQITPKNVLTRPALVFEGTIMPLMLRSAIIAEELSASSVTRGLDCSKKRTSIEILRLTVQDVVWLFAFLILVIFPFIGRFGI